MSRVPPAGYLSLLSRRDWSSAFREAYDAIAQLQQEVRERAPSHALLKLVVVTEDRIEWTPEFDEFRERARRDANPEDTILYDFGRYIERLGNILS